MIQDPELVDGNNVHGGNIEEIDIGRQASGGETGGDSDRWVLFVLTVDTQVLQGDRKVIVM